MLVPALALAACGPAARPAVTDPLAGLGPRRDPPLDVAGDDDDLTRAVADLLATRPGEDRRAELRATLWKAYAARIDAALAADAPLRAFSWLEDALLLWDARELGDPAAPPPDLGPAADVAEKLLPLLSRGGHAPEAVVLLSLMSAARPDRAEAYRTLYLEIEDYLDALATAEHGENARGARTIEIFEVLIHRFPSHWVGETLVGLYIDRQARIQESLKKSGGAAPGFPQAHDPAGLMHPAWNIIRAYSLAGRPADALAVADQLSGQLGDDPQIRERLRVALGKNATGAAWVALAAAYVPDDRRFQPPTDLQAAMAICREGSRRVPEAFEPRACTGEAAMRLDEARGDPVPRLTPLALRELEEASARAPANRDVAEMLARAHRRKLADVLAGERLEAARAQLGRVEKFYADAARRWPGKPLDPPLEDLHLTMGRGFFNAGEIADATRYFEKALDGGKNPDAIEQLAVIRMKHGKPLDAARDLQAAARLPRNSALVEKFTRIHLHRLAGEALAIADHQAEARETWQKALTEVADLLRSHRRELSPMGLSSTLEERARLLYHLGEKDDAEEAFAQAVDSDPEDAGIYASVIAFLLTRGAYDPALDAYHRALGRPTVTDYFKVYTTLWVVAFARLRRVDPDPLAMRFLALQTGSRWYQALARFTLGQLSADELMKLANTRGKRAEAFFYRALERYAAGDRAGAEELLRLVVRTDMLGFFEYDMAAHFLKHGPPR